MSALWRHAVIALGSNLGDRAALIASARAALEVDSHIRIEKHSSLYRSMAVKLEGADPQAPEYLNAVTTVSTDYEPLELLARLLQIERDHGRVREERWGDRTLDLDIVEITGVALDTKELHLPHPRALERDFVCAPWAEIEPDAQLAGRSIATVGSSTDITVFEAAR